MKRISFIFIFLLLPVLAVQAAGEGKAPAAGDKPVVVPFELLRSGHMAVGIKVNGKGPYRVIFDTGAPINLLNTKVGEEAGLLKARPKPIFGIRSGGPVTVKSLTLGELQAVNTQAVVMDHPTVELISRALGPIEGIVGFPFFARYRMTLDYKERTLTFVPSGFEPPDVFQELMANLLSSGAGNVKFLAPAGQWGLVVVKEKNDEADGVVVKEVHPGTPAAAAGLKPGDRLLTVDGRWTDTVADLYHAAGHVKPGTEARVTVRRDKQEWTVTIKPRPGL